MYRPLSGGKMSSNIWRQALKFDKYRRFSDIVSPKRSQHKISDRLVYNFWSKFSDLFNFSKKKLELLRPVKSYSIIIMGTFKQYLKRWKGDKSKLTYFAERIICSIVLNVPYCIVYFIDQFQMHDLKALKTYWTPEGKVLWIQCCQLVS